MYKAVIFEHKQEMSNGDIAEIHIWQVEPSDHYPEGVRYTLVYIRENKRIIGYDNYHGKGHHRHINEREEMYEFVDEWKVIEDFIEDVEKVRTSVIK